MYILITTPRFVLGYDSGTGIVDVLATGSLYFGLTWNPQGTELALTHNVYEGELDNLAQEAMSECGYLSVGDRKTGHFLSMPHQALWVDESYIVVPNTGRNAVARVAVDDLSVMQVRYDDVIWDRNDPRGKGAHYNSAFFDGRFVYFVAHNHSNASCIVKAQWPSLELVERMHLPGISGIHNLWIDDAGRWVTCDSNRGALVDARNGERLWDSRGEGFTRGIAVTDEMIIVGNSERSTRNLRQYTASGLWFIDRRTMELRDYVLLRHYGVVHDVRLADVPDAAHHGKPIARGALSPLRNAQNALERDTLHRARAQLPDPQRWCPRIGVFLTENGKEVAKNGELALMTQREGGAFSDGRISARVYVHKWDSAGHADLVLRYTGPADSCMYAAVLQSNGAGALTASVWVEDGGWMCIATAAIPGALLARFDLQSGGLPIAFVAHGSSLCVEVDAEVVLRVSDTRLAAGAAGLRMVGDAFGIGNFAKSVD